MDYKDMIFNWLSTFATTSRGRPLTTPGDPYIQYDLVEASFAEHFIQPLSIYHIGANGYGDIMTIKNAIEANIGESGRTLRSEDCIVRIYKGSPFYQDRDMGEENAKAGYINLEITILKEI